jgi:hypothetical protein
LKVRGQNPVQSKKDFCIDSIFLLRLTAFLKVKPLWTILFFGGWTLFFGLPFRALSQELNPPTEISDDELKKFATVKLMTLAYLESKTGELKKRILSENAISGGARYNEIKAAWGDSSKEQKVNLTEEERAAFRSIVNFQDSLQQTVLSYQVALIKNEKVLGEALYLRVVEALNQDQVLKEKLDQLIETLEVNR